MQKHMLQMEVVLIVALITTGIGVRGPLASSWRGGRSRCPNRGCRLLTTLVIVLCVSAVAQAVAPCHVPSNAYPTIQAAVNRPTCAPINVAAGTYPELIEISRDVRILGAGQESTVIDGGRSGTVLTIARGTVTIKGVTIQNGASFEFFGGGILNEGTLTVQNSTVWGNSAGANIGGGIYNGGMLTVQDSTFSDNSVGSAGGGIANGGTLTVENSTISGNSATSDGGGIFNFNGGMVTLTDVTFQTNTPNDCTGCPGLL